MENESEEEGDRGEAVGSRCLLLNRDLSEKHFNCASPLSEICRVIAGVSFDFAADSSPLADNRPSGG